MTSEIMKCGNCGKRRVTLRAVTDGDRHAFVSIRARCCHCKSVTVFSISTPVIQSGWGRAAKGIMCAGWRKK